jgi:putative DNA primase/helicase
MNMLAIATGKSRTDVRWKNLVVSWDKLKAKLQTPLKTAETVADYKAMEKARQAEIKDVGGFVGGRLKGDRRTARNVELRSLVVLDLDYAHKDTVADIDMLLDFSWAVYSTHTHTPAAPRLRLLVPLKRTVTPDEYGPVARWLAKLVGIEQCDASTYDPSRLMYWPSVSIDGQYIYAEGGSGSLDPDLALSSYPDWRNPIYWPVAENETRAQAKERKDLGDPGLKQGPIGAFCRCYPISVAIDEFLGDVYTEAGAGRYTYVAGSTAGGAVVYEDKWLCSHHGTDPCGGLTVNSFDLVRIHLYGELDKDVSTDTPVIKLPSYRAALGMVVELDAVKAELVAERSGEIELDFAGIGWEKELAVDKKGIIASGRNVAIILINAPEFLGALRKNLLTGRYEVHKKLVWDHDGMSYPRQWRDADDAQLRVYLEEKYRIKGRELVYDGFVIAAETSAYHPVRMYLAELPAWDGVARVETLLVDYFGAEDTRLNREVTRKTMVGAVKRVMHPGCKFDEVLTLHGAQGMGKSTLWKKLAMQWFSDSIEQVEGKEAIEQLSGVWIGEMGEMKATKKAEVEALKAYLSRQVDKGRQAYGRHTEDHPRQCIIVATTNEHEFLRDRTGNRRFWTVRLQVQKAIRSVFEMTQDTVDQVWAEALRLYKKDDTLFLSREAEATMYQVQEAFEEDNGTAGLIEDYLEAKVPAGWRNMSLMDKQDFIRGSMPHAGELERIVETCALEIALVGLKYPRTPNNTESRMIGEIVRKLEGWEYCAGKISFGNGLGRQRHFKRPN